jgi:tripartite-type tricarboxylate transporter receptor subunit TctC
VIGTNVVAKADPDGYTMLFGSSGALAAALSLYSKVPYDPVKDLAAVAIVADVTLLLAVNPKLPVNTVQELVALAKSKPGVLNVALPAVGSIHHLLTEQFKIDANIDMMNVPFNGSSPAAVALVTGTVDVEIDSLPTLLPFVKTGRLKGLAVASKTRSALVPDVPTMGEAGLPNIVASPWFIVMVPAGTPQQPIETINSALAEISKIPAYREKMAALGANVRRSTPQEASTLIANEVSRWAQVAKKSGAKLE